MLERHLSENSRIFTGEYGSVWVKNLAKQFSEFTVLSYHPGERRIKAQKCRMQGVGTQPVVNLTTVNGSYIVGAKECVRLATGEVKSVEELTPGVPLQSGVIINVEGNITVQTIFRDIWLDELLEADLNGVKMNLVQHPDRRAESKQHLLRVEPLGPQVCYRAIIECETAKEPLEVSGHNLLIWPDGTSFGAGIFAY